MKLDDLKHVFKSSAIGPVDTRGYIVSLLNKFEVALTWDSRTLLIPSLLPCEEDLHLPSTNPVRVKVLCRKYYCMTFYFGLVYLCKPHCLDSRGSCSYCVEFCGCVKDYMLFLLRILVSYLRLWFGSLDFIRYMFFCGFCLVEYEVFVFIYELCNFGLCCSFCVCS